MSLTQNIAPTESGHPKISQASQPTSVNKDGEKKSLKMMGNYTPSNDSSIKFNFPMESSYATIPKEASPFENAT